MKTLRTMLLAALALLPALAVAGPASADPGVTTGAVNVRSGPGTRFSTIDSLRKGEVVDIVRCQAAWCFVSYDQGSADGWVNQRYLAAVDVPRKKKRLYRSPSYDRFDDPFFDGPFCDRFWPRQPPGCGYYGPGPFPTHPPSPPPHQPPGPPKPPPAWPKPPDWPGPGANPWPGPPNWPAPPNGPGWGNPAIGGGGYCPPVWPQCRN